MVGTFLRAFLFVFCATIGASVLKGAFHGVTNANASQSSRVLTDPLPGACRHRQALYNEWAAGKQEAHYYLGMALHLGRCFPRDNEAAFEKLKYAADRNIAPAQKMIGHFYAFGWSMDRDPMEAEKWFRKAIAGGNTQSETALGRLLLGKPDPEALSEAISLLQKASNEGDGTAKFLLGMAHLRGHGVEADYASAAELLRHSASLGFPTGQLAYSEAVAKAGKSVSDDHVVLAYAWAMTGGESLANTMRSVRSLDEAVFESMNAEMGVIYNDFDDRQARLAMSEISKIRAIPLRFPSGLPFTPESLIATSSHYDWAAIMKMWEG